MKCKWYICKTRWQRKEKENNRQSEENRKKKKNSKLEEMKIKIKEEEEGTRLTIQLFIYLIISTCCCRSWTFSSLFLFLCPYFDSYFPWFLLGSMFPKKNNVCIELSLIVEHESVTLLKTFYFLPAKYSRRLLWTS